MTIDGKYLLAHMRIMQGVAGTYLEPAGGYRSISGEVAVNDDHRNALFANDMVYLLDGPEQRKAEAATGFDYVGEATLTLSDQFHGDMVGRAHFIRTLNDAIDALAALDKVKKTLFYGRDNNIAPNTGERSCEGFLSTLVAANTMIEGGFTPEDAANYIHGVIGLATEAGELLENLKDAMNGNAIDRVNVKEEVGDGKWYMAILATVGQFEWGDDERVNIAKLRARFPDRFTEWDAQNRRLDVEREILELARPVDESHLPIHERQAKMPGERNLDGEALEAQK